MISMASTTIYLIDDEPICLETMAAVLKALGHECVQCTDGPEFISHLKSLRQLPERGVILADFRLPRMSGLQLFRETRALGCDLPFVLISGHADQDLVESSLQAGVSSFLQKPIDFGVLRDEIDAVLASSR